MSADFLEKYATRHGAPDAAVPEDVDMVDDLGSFGWLRGIRDRAIMLELRKKTGSIVAIGYSWLERVEFDPSEGITLCALGQKIHIRGRNLNAEVRPMVRLFEGVARQRVPWVREATRHEPLGLGQTAVLIESIEW